MSEIPRTQLRSPTEFDAMFVQLLGSRKAAAVPKSRRKRLQRKLRTANGVFIRFGCSEASRNGAIQ